MSKVWFVTGASKGLGLALVKKLLARGETVAATSRHIFELKHAVNEVSENFLPIEMDVSNEQKVKEAITKTVRRFGRIDVVVNNAGYGQYGTIEELTDQETRENFEVNVFGMLNVIRNVLPYLRAQHSGHIFNLSSIGGFVTSSSGWGIYSATKFAVAGLSEALEADVKHFGIKVTVVYPGLLRTDFLGADSLRTPEHPINEYIEARNHQEIYKHALHHHEPGNPNMVALGLIEVAYAPVPPLHLFLGADSYDMVRAKISMLEMDLEEWKGVTLITDYQL
jgi:NAD(P)-dependent dehydrogenase (short-subunit alcohol dehydrogenase family)